jgi:hypothetical protein
MRLIPRMTTRRWMVAVAAAGLLMGGIVGGVRLKRRRFDFARRAEVHAILKTADERAVVALQVDNPQEAARLLRSAGHRAMLIRKYRHAARYPWLPVESDPPWPE